MVASAAFFPIAVLPPDCGSKPLLTKLGSSNVDAFGMKPKSSSSKSLKFTANAQAPLKINGTSVGLSSATEGVKRTFINQLPDWSTLLAAITTVFLAAEKQWMMLLWKPKRPDVLMDTFGLGRMV